MLCFKKTMPFSVFLILLWLILVRFLDPTVYMSIKQGVHTFNIFEYIETFMSVLFYVSLTVVGLYTDLKFSRLNVVLFTATIGVCGTSMFIVQSALPTTTWITYIASPILTYSKRFLAIVALSLGADQLYEASSQQLSTYVWWYYWCLSLGWSFAAIAACWKNNSLIYNVSITSLHLFGVIIILLTGFVFKKYFIHHTPFRNPLKLIYNVLKFAWKNKYPVQRSALTYWEHKHPSRINLGKDKYGGPFTEAEVEDVKAFFCLIPLIIVIAIVYVPVQPIARLSTNLHQTIDQCLLNSTYFVYYAVQIVAIPIHQFCKNYFRCNISMLQLIGLGLLLQALSRFGYVAIDLFVTTQEDNNQTCLFQANNNNSQNIPFVQNTYVFLIPNVIAAIGSLFILPGTVRFVFAQAPYSMRSILIGLWYSNNGLFELIGWKITVFIRHSPSMKPSCEFSIFLMNLIVSCLAFVLFILLSARYKLRSRGDCFNPHAIAESYYVNDFRRRELYNKYGTTS